METRKFRFKKSLHVINGVHNIPAYVICSGHGYDFKTFCCKNCGELFVLDLELLHSINKTLEILIGDKNCPKCNEDFETSLIEYPENIYHNGSIIKNNNAIDKLAFDETELLDAYFIH